jgi:predicted helicase
MLKKHPDLKLPPLTDTPDEKRSISPDEPFVQVLDPATGTATFLVEVVDVIHRTLAAKWKQQRLTEVQQLAAWNDYVPKHLLPRLYAYELMMAPYAIAHMKIGLKLAETKYHFGSEERVRIYLTNALEPWQGQLKLPDFEALAHEAVAVNEVKREKRFTVIIGNPPYSNYGMFNKNSFVLGLLEDYKRGLDEKKLNLDDDFIKFVRFSQHLIDMTRVGIVGMITNNVFLDGLTHRQMRESLSRAFQKIFFLNLHGDTRKKEENPTGDEDKNIFDIQQGVSVSLLSKTPNKTNSCYLHADIWGTRDSKYTALERGNVTETRWKEINPTFPNFFFVPKNFANETEYSHGVSAKDIFVSVGKGMKTERDRVSIHFTKDSIKQAVADFRKDDIATLKKKYLLDEDSRDWKVAWAKTDVTENNQPNCFRPILYRPFDVRYTWYSGQTRGFIGTPGYAVLRHMLADNFALILTRQVTGLPYNHCFVTRTLAEIKCASHDRCCDVVPLTLYSSDTLSLRTDSAPNLKPSFLKILSVALKLSQQGAHGLPTGLTPEDIFHYIYAVFHSPSYRNRYAEFLKIDFPRLPLTGNLKLFRALSHLGGELVALHLLESPKLDHPITEFIGGNNPEAEKSTWSENTVWVDKAQTIGFKGVREDVWNFHIGGYQVCQKWLKDRKGRTLAKDDIVHYQKIVISLSETIRLMAEIDKVIETHGGWPDAFQASADEVAK